MKNENNQRRKEIHILDFGDRMILKDGDVQAAILD
jgi:hypothetical protein